MPRLLAITCYLLCLPLLRGQTYEATLAPNDWGGPPHHAVFLRSHPTADEAFLRQVFDAHLAGELTLFTDSACTKPLPATEADLWPALEVERADLFSSEQAMNNVDDWGEDLDLGVNLTQWQRCTRQVGGRISCQPPHVRLHLQLEDDFSWAWGEEEETPSIAWRRSLYLPGDLGALPLDALAYQRMPNAQGYERPEAALATGRLGLRLVSFAVPDSLVTYTLWDAVAFEETITTGPWVVRPGQDQDPQAWSDSVLQAWQHPLWQPVPTPTPAMRYVRLRPTRKFNLPRWLGKTEVEMPQAAPFDYADLAERLLPALVRDALTGTLPARQPEQAAPLAAPELARRLFNLREANPEAQLNPDSPPSAAEAMAKVRPGDLQLEIAGRLTRPAAELHLALDSLWLLVRSHQHSHHVRLFRLPIEALADYALHDGQPLLDWLASLDYPVALRQLNDVDATLGTAATYWTLLSMRRWDLLPNDRFHTQLEGEGTVRWDAYYTRLRAIFTR